MNRSGTGPTRYWIFELLAESVGDLFEKYFSLGTHFSRDLYACSHHVYNYIKVYYFMRMLPLRKLYGWGNLSGNCICVSPVFLTLFAYVTWTSRLWLFWKGKLSIYLRRKVTHVLYNRPSTVKFDSEFWSLDVSRGVKIDVISSGIWHRTLR
jgi:hypothetical protein